MRRARGSIPGSAPVTVNTNIVVRTVVSNSNSEKEDFWISGQGILPVLNPLDNNKNENKKTALGELRPQVYLDVEAKRGRRRWAHRAISAGGCRCDVTWYVYIEPLAARGGGGVTRQPFKNFLLDASLRGGLFPPLSQSRLLDFR